MLPSHKARGLTTTTFDPTQGHCATDKGRKRRLLGRSAASDPRLRHPRNPLMASSTGRRLKRTTPPRSTPHFGGRIASVQTRVPFSAHRMCEKTVHHYSPEHFSSAEIANDKLALTDNLR